jgi:hypothetical protein
MMYERSALPSSPGGVGSARKIIWLWLTASDRIGSKMQAAFFGIAFEKQVEAGFKNGDFAVFKAFYFFFVDVNTDDIVAGFGETGSGNQTDITGSNNSNIHDAR